MYLFVGTIYQHHIMVVTQLELHTYDWATVAPHNIIDVNPNWKLYRYRGHTI